MPKVSNMLKAKSKSVSKHWVESALDIVLLDENKREVRTDINNNENDNFSK